ncbi:MAG: glycosyl transferase [Clostridia bacterium]|nr:glycosyl transferase [Clostridia bacterium]
MIVEKLYRVKRYAIKAYHKYFTIENPHTYILSDKSFIKKLYKKRMGREINLSNPQTFTEKQNWLKLYDRKPIYTVMVDKYLAREFVKERIGEEYLVPLLGVWNNADEIDFSELPDKFVLKCNHNSDVIIFKDGIFTSKNNSILTQEEAIKKLNEQLKVDYYQSKREWPYKNIPRKIICEKYMENCDGTNPIEYKVFCFNGKARYVIVMSERFSDSGISMDTYDIEWKYTNLINGDSRLMGDVFEKPKNFDDMINIAQKLSADIPFLRVDFNCWNEQTYFGELTFFDAAGFEHYQPEEWDSKLGELITLPKKRGR